MHSACFKNRVRIIMAPMVHSNNSNIGWLSFATFVTQGNPVLCVGVGVGVWVWVCVIIFSVFIRNINIISSHISSLIATFHCPLSQVIILQRCPRHYEL